MFDRVQLRTFKNRGAYEQRLAELITKAGGDPSDLLVLFPADLLAVSPLHNSTFAPRLSQSLMGER
jgi:hypothetical protein